MERSLPAAATKGSLPLLLVSPFLTKSVEIHGSPAWARPHAVQLTMMIRRGSVARIAEQAFLDLE